MRKNAPDSDAADALRRIQAVIDRFAPGKPCPEGESRALDPAAIADQVEELATGLESAESARADVRFLASVLENLPHMVFVQDARDLRLVRVNRAGEEFLGHPREMLVGRQAHELLPKEQAVLVTARDRAALERGDLTTQEEPLETKKGSRFLRTKKIPIPDEHGVPEFLLTISEDITARRQATALLEKANLGRLKAKEEFSVLLHHFPGALWTTDFELRVVSAAGASAELLGLGPEALGTSLADRIPAAALAIGALHAVADLGRANYEFHHCGRTFQVAVSTLRTRQTANLIWVATDVTQGRQIDAEMLRASLERGQKLEQIGLLAGGVALDFNNLLTAVLGNASLARQSLPSDSKALEYLGRVEESADVAADLSRQLLAYSGRSRLLLEPLRLGELVERMARLLQSSVAKGVTFAFDFEPDAPFVRGDSAQLRQLVMNLITNASDSFTGSDGTITLRTRTRAVASGELDDVPGAEKFGPGRYLVLEVGDNGHGMDVETQERIFDPFFSTKPRGHGLGLAATLGIVRGHGGKIRVRSEPRKGTLFELFLPVAPAARTSSTHLQQVHPPPPKGTVVLVVDDEESVRRLTVAALTRAECEVVTAANGVEALQRMAERSDIAAVLLDVMMPQMDGAQTMRLMQERVPDLPIILTSGYGEEGIRQRLRAQGTAFLRKPFRAEDLVAKLSAVLATEPSA